MKKKLLGFMLTMIVVISLAACGGNEKATDAENTKTEIIDKINDAEKNSDVDETGKAEKPVDDASINQNDQDFSEVAPEVTDDPNSFVVMYEGDGFVAYEPKNNFDDQMDLGDGITLENILKIMDMASDNGVYNDGLLRQMACVVLKDKDTVSGMTAIDLADALAPWAVLGFYFEEGMPNIVVLSVKVEDGKFTLAVTVNGEEDIWHVNERAFIINHGETNITTELDFYDEVWQYIVDTNTIVEYFDL